MIAGSLKPCAVGSRGVGMFDKDVVWHKDQPYIVAREATYEEWVAQQVDHGRQREWVIATYPNVGDHYFYEVLVD